MSFQCIFCGRQTKTKGGNTIHQNRCHANPNRRTPSAQWYAAMSARKGSGQNQYTKDENWTISEETRLKLSEAAKNRTIDQETRSKISESMKAAHREGRAWNIGQSRWNNKPSYPEAFFMQVIVNEFSDQNYIREYPVGRYSCDFAWPHLMRVIEIDGDQHYRFDEYRQRDARKDNLLKELGWRILRIRWADFCSQTKSHIEQAKAFIDAP